MQQRWLELLKDYDIDIFSHPWKENVVADALCRKMIASTYEMFTGRHEITKDIYQLSSLRFCLL